MLSKHGISLVLFTCTFFLLSSIFDAVVHGHGHLRQRSRSQEVHATVPGIEVEDSICKSSALPYFYDYSAKKRSEPQLCPKDTLLSRDVVVEDYSCSESKPCKNGACCSKSSGFCGYGPASCGIDGKSPNDKCWSNCDAHAECGEFALPAGKKCPLNVCCSEFGFCGMTEDFCNKDGTKGCQSNCDQPGSGSSGGDVQKRIIGYYESWAHDRSCSGMTFKDIPVESLTHLNFAFGYIQPGTFEVVPMDDLPPSLFSDFTELKSRNRGLKAIISLGGWTFNDNGTSTQPVFSDMVSSADNRSKFIRNLFAFMKHYGFDGVDIDWEYPGAPDRGGHRDDGINLTTFLKELKDAIAGESTKYEVSFTAPTSYWYLRWFDIEETMKNVDFANIMSYEYVSLHGIWDSQNPIGSRVLAHTNLTEITQALNLLWRNNVDPAKLNLGLGFYGRSFQLSDPGCSQPGCLFKGGAASGTCTKNSGTLSYKEIDQIISQDSLTPIYDKENAVKYITWNRDQWVSYDDQETFQQKIKFANKLGLGGLLIWAIDQDTENLDALRAVLYPGKLNAFNSQADEASYWEDAVAGDCRVTECGGKCVAGEIPITTQPCGGAARFTRRSKGDDSTLCCPVSAAPDPKKCRWDGGATGAPLCNGQCNDGEVALQSNKWGDGKYCEDGLKFYCCEIPEAKNIDCYWQDQCNAGDTLMTFEGTFLSTVADIVGTFGGLIGTALADVLDDFDIELSKRFCCTAEEAPKWKGCSWRGEPGSCFDNHCDTGHQVQLTESAHGQGESCFPRLERSRAFCCDPSNGQSPFLPVPLEYLFPNPPPKDTANTEFDLKIDPSWGTGKEKGDDDPNNASFGFVVLTSPHELQQTLDKRDGSHWELFDCFDSMSEEEQTIRMFCTDSSAASNCNKIHLGHGVPGTILEMPEGCGPGRYAVAKALAPSKNQELPRHLTKRNLGSNTIYDLTFDYDFTRVPRDLGDTQMRVDFSNEEGYWNSVVNKAGNTKQKRSLAEAGGNHKRWLEDEWRDDLHFGALSREELHKRWFGSDVIDWLRGVIAPFRGTNGLSHSINQEFTAILVDEQFGPCPIGGASVQANLEATFKAQAKVDTNFGLTIIAKLAPLDLRQSYLYFKNKGEITAKFTLDAIASATFDTGPRELFGLENFPGATFRVPGIVTVGPNFRLFASVDAKLVLAGHLESQVKIASWEVQQTYPQQSQEFEPKDLDSPDRDGTQILGSPTFDYSVSARGEVTAHLMPTFTFGIDFDPSWKVDGCKVDLVADGWVRLMASAEASGNPSTCPFTYGVDAGADLYTQVTIPHQFDFWGSNKRFDIAQIPPKQIIQGGSCPQSQQKRDLLHARDYNSSERVLATRSIYKRDTVGPLITIPSSFLQCPGGGNSVDEIKCAVCGPASEVTGDLRRRADEDVQVCRLPPAPPQNQRCEAGGTSTKRGIVLDKRNVSTSWDTPHGTDHLLEKRARTGRKSFNWRGTTWEFSEYPSCDASDPPDAPAKWYTFLEDKGCSARFAKQRKSGNNVGNIPISNFATDHVFEVQLIINFLKWLAGERHNNPLPMRAGPGWSVGSADWIGSAVMGLSGNNAHQITNQNINPHHLPNCLDIITRHYVGSKDNTLHLALLLDGVNGAKGKWLSGDVNIAAAGRSLVQTVNNIRESAGVFNYLSLTDIHDKFTAPSRSIEQLFHEFDISYPWGTRNGEPGRGPNGNGGLRNYWCYWIDAQLTQVERNVRLWRGLAANAINNYIGSNGQAEKYRDGEFKTGASGQAAMQFRRPNGNNPLTDESLFGMWGGQGYGAP